MVLFGLKAFSCNDDDGPISFDASGRHIDRRHCSVAQSPMESLWHSRSRRPRVPGAVEIATLVGPGRLFLACMGLDGHQLALTLQMVDCYGFDNCFGLVEHWSCYGVQSSFFAARETCGSSRLLSTEKINLLLKINVFQ